MLSLMGYPLPPDPPRPCLVCHDPHSRQKSVFCSTKCKQAFLEQSRSRHAIDSQALAFFNQVMQG